MKKMKKEVCVLTTVHSPFDTRIHHKEIQSLLKAGYKITLIAPADKGFTEGNFKLVPLKKHSSVLKRFFLSNFQPLRFALKLKSDVYHFHDPELIFVGLTLKMLGKKVIYDVHEDYELAILSKPYLKPPIRKSISFIFNLLEKNLSRSFDAIITATDEIKPKFFPYNRRTVLVRNYPWIKDFKDVKLKANGGAKLFKLIYIGSLTPMRGIKEIVQALEMLPDDVTLVLAGKFYSKEFEKEVLSLPAFKKVNYLGQIPLEKVTPLLYSADVGLVPFYPEPNHLQALPTKLFEYMAAGLPLIVSNIPNCEKLVKKGSFGLVVNPKSPEEIAEAVKTLKDQPELRKEMGERGRKVFLSKYNFEQEEKVLLNLYESLTN